MLEQPSSSVLRWHPRIRKLFRDLPKAGMKIQKGIVKCHELEERETGNFIFKVSDSSKEVYSKCGVSYISTIYIVYYMTLDWTPLQQRFQSGIFIGFPHDLYIQVFSKSKPMFKHETMPVACL